MYAVGACFNGIKEQYTNLASELGNTDGQLEGGGPLLDVGLEVGELDVVPVNWHLVNATVSTARLEEAGDPIKAIGG
jgi:hypothetical protein